MNVSPYLLLCLTSLFWSLNFIIGKLLVGVIPPVTLSFLRWFPSLLFFLVFYRKDLWQSRMLFRRHWGLLLILGGTGYFLNSIAAYEAVRFTSTINTSFINAFNPVLIAIAGYLVYRYPVTRMQCAGFLVSLLGVLCIIFKGEPGHILQLRINIGDLFMVGSIVLWSIHTVVYKNNAGLVAGRVMFCLMMLGGQLLCLPLAIADGMADHWQWLGLVGWPHVVGILALSVFPSTLAYLFWNYALSRIPANQVAMFQYLIPVYTTLISVVFLGEQLRAFHLAGGGLIFFGVFLVTNSRLVMRILFGAEAGQAR
jgi:drug/metabolite transporter (DMT)-like permease